MVIGEGWSVCSPPDHIERAATRRRPQRWPPCACLLCAAAALRFKAQQHPRRLILSAQHRGAQACAPLLQATAKRRAHLLLTGCQTLKRASTAGAATTGAFLAATRPVAADFMMEAIAAGKVLGVGKGRRTGGDEERGRLGLPL